MPPSPLLAPPLSADAELAVDGPARLAAVASLRLTGRVGDPHLDAVVATVAAALRVPIAVVNVVTPDRQTYPAEVGAGRGCTTLPDSLSFCAEVVTTGRPLVVPDACDHPAYRDNPLVANGAVRAYAGHPVLHAGQVIGALAVFDPVVREFTDAELEVLGHQARLVGAILSLRALSAWDALTGLPARPLLLDRVERALSNQAGDDRLTGLVVLDVAGMAEVNLRYGSETGDALLQAVAERLRSVVLQHDSIARIGGDEFAAVLEDLASTEEARTRAAELAEAARGPLAVRGELLQVELSTGVATTPTAGADALLAAAEHAASLRAGQAGGRLALPVAPPSDVQLDLDLAAATADLRRGIFEDEFVVHYQPLVELTSGTTRGVEALVRWQHPQHGLRLPGTFIPQAEASGLVLPLGMAVLRAAAAQAAAWHRAGRDLTVSVNLSPTQMAHPSFVATVREVLADTGAPADRLVLEITESSVMDHPSALETIGELHALGIRFALDDFGTGYSSLSYLRRFPVDSIKIDRSFVAGLGRHADDEAIVASVVDLARKVDKAVVAEGVETIEQAAALRAMGVPLAQGFLWSRALPVAELESWLDAPRAIPAQVQPRRPVPVAAAPAPAEVLLAPAGGVEERIWAMHSDGASLHTIAAALNAEGSRTERGVRWHTRSVALVVASWTRGSLTSR